MTDKHTPQERKQSINTCGVYKNVKCTVCGKPLLYRSEDSPASVCWDASCPASKLQPLSRKQSIESAVAALNEQLQAANSEGLRVDLRADSTGYIETSYVDDNNTVIRTPARVTLYDVAEWGGE